MLIGFAVHQDLSATGSRRGPRAPRRRRARPGPPEDRLRGDVRHVGGDRGRPHGLAVQRQRRPAAALAAAVHAAGRGVCALAQMHIFGGGEATSFLIAKGQYGEAAQVDFYRMFGFIPLIATTALASGAYGVAGFTLVYPIGYLLPNPLLAAVIGALVFAAEVLALSYIGGLLGRLPSVRDSSEHLRAAISETLHLAILFGSLMAANAMGAGLGILIVGGLYLLNDAMGRPVVRMAAAPAAVIIGGIVLNLLHWMDLFTPSRADPARRREPDRPVRHPPGRPVRHPYEAVTAHERRSPYAPYGTSTAKPVRPVRRTARRSPKRAPAP
ncbi:YhfT family protein [Streptomyces sp. M19]